MYRIKNTADDRSKHLLHRTANQFELEPSLGGKRIRLRSHLDITDEHYERVKSMVDVWEKKGIVEVSRLNADDSLDDLRKFASKPEFNADGLRLGGPTFEEWTQSLKQPPEDYPPEGFAEVFSPGLVAFRREQEEASKKLGEAGAQIIEDAMSLPSITEQILPLVPEPPPVLEDPVAAAPPSPPPTTIPAAPPVAPTNKDKSKKKLF